MNLVGTSDFKLGSLRIHTERLIFFLKMCGLLAANV